MSFAPTRASMPHCSHLPFHRWLQTPIMLVETMRVLYRSRAIQSSGGCTLMTVRPHELARRRCRRYGHYATQMARPRLHWSMVQIYVVRFTHRRSSHRTEMIHTKGWSWRRQSMILTWRLRIPSLLTLNRKKSNEKMYRLLSSHCTMLTAHKHLIILFLYRSSTTNNQYLPMPLPLQKCTPHKMNWYAWSTHSIYPF